MVKPMSGVRSRSRWETSGDGWMANFCMRLVKNRKSSILASDSPTHIWRPGEMDMVEDYKIYEHKNLSHNLDKDKSCPCVISPTLECTSSEPHGLFLSPGNTKLTTHATYLMSSQEGDGQLNKH